MHVSIRTKGVHSGLKIGDDISSRLKTHSRDVRFGTRCIGSYLVRIELGSNSSRTQIRIMLSMSTLDAVAHFNPVQYVVEAQAELVAWNCIKGWSCASRTMVSRF